MLLLGIERLSNTARKGLRLSNEYRHVPVDRKTETVLCPPEKCLRRSQANTTAVGRYHQLSSQLGHYMAPQTVHRRPSLFPSANATKFQGW